MKHTHQQITVKDETFVLVPLTEYTRLADEAEDAAEEAWAAKVYDDHIAAKARGEDLAMPKEQWARIREGVSPVTVVREYRGMTQKTLAEETGVSQSEVSAIEAGKRRGTVDTFIAMARALKAPVEVLAGGEIPSDMVVTGSRTESPLVLHLAGKDVTSWQSPISGAVDLENTMRNILAELAKTCAVAPEMTSKSILELWHDAARKSAPTIETIIAQARANAMDG